MTSEPGVRYRFGPRERGGALAGWRAGQILTVAVGLVFGVLVLRWQPNVAGVAAALGILVLYGALATVPVAGRTGDEWLPVAVCFEARRRGGPRSGPMRTLHGLRLLEAEWQSMGVVHDRAARTLTAALSLRGRSFALLGSDEQDRRVGSWASLLASAARDGSPVHRLQWLASSFPDDGRGVRSFLTESAAPAAPSTSRASYESLLDEVGSHACTHDVLLTVQVRQRSTVEAGCAVLAREVGSLVRLLGDADVVVEGLLGAADLARRFSRAYEPDQPGGAAAEGGGAVFDGARPDDRAPDDAWPMAMAEEWSSVRVDGMVHATFWVAEWPRTEVRSDFLAPLLLSSARATLSVVMEPLGPDAAVRKVEGAADGGPGRRRATAARRVHVHGAPGARVRGVGAPGGRAGRGSRVLPLLGLRDRLGAERGGARAGLRRDSPCRGSEPARPAAPLRRSGVRLHLHAAARPGSGVSGRRGSP